MTEQDREEKREIRTLKWQVRQLGKQLGRAGATIHQLRGANAALREMAARSPGEYDRLFAQLRAAQVENRRLRDKLDAKEGGDQRTTDVQ